MVPDKASTGGDGVVDQVARGRRPSTTRREVARTALELFARQGYDQTSIDQIATAVGISRRTFFRYYESKREVVWGEFDAELIRLADRLEAADDDEPMMEVLRSAVIDINRFGAGELDELRIRIGLTSTVPTLIAHSAVRYAEWCEVVARFAARRLGTSPDDLAPQTVARTALGAAMSAFVYWANRGVDDLATEVDRAFRMLAAGFDPRRMPD
jgi:TetR/AcrR family transcriptional regulator, regulator of mycofactocin system